MVAGGPPPPRLASDDDGTVAEPGPLDAWLTLLLGS
jgi:hypothetical protein